MRTVSFAKQNCTFRARKLGRMQETAERVFRIRLPRCSFQRNLCSESDCRYQPGPGRHTSARMRHLQALIHHLLFSWRERRAHCSYAILYSCRGIVSQERFLGLGLSCSAPIAARTRIRLEKNIFRPHARARFARLFRSRKHGRNQQTAEQGVRNQIAAA